MGGCNFNCKLAEAIRWGFCCNVFNNSQKSFASGDDRTINYQLSTIDSQLSTLNSQLSTLNQFVSCGFDKVINQPFAGAREFASQFEVLTA
ncbi:MAG: hypothetical protein HC894_26295 [Microcoleus sp. SM1_3_4]|nr:hypothetical protein [Microcoleus sp. SM1_3_4]